MNYTQQDIKEIVINALLDMKIEYYLDKEFFIKFQLELSYMNVKHDIKKPWICIVSGPDYQFGGVDGGYVFTIDDEPPHTIFFQDASGGQIPNSFIKKDENGKYYREYILG